MSGRASPIAPASGDEDTMVDARSELTATSSATTVFYEHPDRSQPVGPPFEGRGPSAPLAARSRGCDARSSTGQVWWRKVTLPWSKRVTIELGAALAFTIALAILALHQWHVADELRRAVAQLRSGREQTSALERPLAPNPGPTPRKSISGSKASAPLSLDELERLESHGAGLIAAHDNLDALAHYRELVSAAPHREVFQALVVVLESKLRCLRGATEAEGPCP